MAKFKNTTDFWMDRWRRKPDASGAKPMTYSAIQDRLTELMEEGLLKIEGKKILDLGCGRGEILEWLVGVHGGIGTGVDIGIPAITYLQGRRLVQAIHGEVQRFRYIEKFDVVFSSFVLQHMISQEDITAFYETALFHLAPRGIIILVDTFGEHAPQPYTQPRPVAFHEAIWKELGLKPVNSRALQPQEPHKQVITLKRKRHGWEKKEIQEISGEIVGIENEVTTSLVQFPPMSEISVPSEESLSIIESSSPKLFPLPDLNVTIPPIESSMSAPERVSGLSSTDAPEPVSPAPTSPDGW